MRCPRCDRRLTEGDRFCGRCGLSRSTDGKPIDPLIGITVAGRYRIDRRIGVGGMGTVYLGVHERIGQQVAIKVLHERYAGDEQLTRRFEKEALTYGQVTHPNLVGLHDYGRTDDGTFFMVLEYCPGISLAQLVRRQGRLDAALATDILIQVAQGLGAAHGMGIVHRDLKPENVILTRIRPGHYHARLLDFGIAKRLDDDGPRLTAAGMVFGTPEYMAPEQARGKPVDGRSDIYALGCVAYELLTGNPPFTGGDKLRIMHQQAGDPPPPLTDHVGPTDTPIPAALDAVTMRCLAKAPGDRYPDTEAVIAALERALGNPTAAPVTLEAPATDAGPESGAPRAAPRVPLARDDGASSREIGTLPQASPEGGSFGSFGGFASGLIEGLPTDLGAQTRPGPPAKALVAAAVGFVGVVAFSAWLFSAGDAPQVTDSLAHEAAVTAADPVAEGRARAAASERRADASETRVAVQRAAAPASKPSANRPTAQPTAETRRLAAPKADAQRLADQKAEDTRLAAKAAETKRLAEQKAAEQMAAEQKAAEQKSADTRRLAAQKAAETKRLAETQRLADEKRLAAQKAAEEKRLADEKRRADAQRAAALADARKALKLGQFDEVEKTLRALDADEAPEAKALVAQLGTVKSALAQGQAAFESADCVQALAALEPVLEVAPGTRGVSHMVNSCRNSLPPRQL